MGVLRNYAPPRRYVPAVKRLEQNLHRAVVQYMNLRYPHILYRTDGAGFALSKTQAGIYKALNATSGWPDLFIAYPSRNFHGLFIELKKEGTTIVATRGERKGKIVADLHIQAQAVVLQQLNNAGYYARFGVGLDNCRRIIDWYMGREDDPTLF